MLRELHISNLAVIEDLTVSFEAGLNVFTGQTGAGKSLVIGAFEALLGMRSAGDMIRPGSREARISGVFELSDTQVLDQIGTIVDQELHAGDQLLLTRKLFPSGRSSMAVNGQPVTAAMVRRVAECLVDIHGQHDHQYLLRSANQLTLLDEFAKCAAARERFAKAYTELRELQQRREALTASQMLRRQQSDLYSFQAGEIDDASPQPGEFPDLRARQRMLSNVQGIKQDAATAQAALYESEDAVGERLQSVVNLLQQAADADESLSPIVGQLQDAAYAVQESSFELNRYIDQLEHDPAELAEIDERLNVLNRLIQKYGGGAASLKTASAGETHDSDPLAPVLAYREQIGRELEELRGQDDDLAGIDSQMQRLASEMERIGTQLTAARTRAGKKLAPKVEAELKQLGMAEARFEVRVTPLKPDREAADAAGAGGANASGLDRVEFVVQTNPGQAFSPLRKVASGGELSRVMLGLKSILAGSDRISVLVFDEIDSNIGGRLGSIIGQKLRALASPRKQAAHEHQVLVITHLPQIAAFADRHFRIAKAVNGKGKQKKTSTTVSVLEGKTRVEELAEMMAGVEHTATTRKQAKELLAAAA